MNRREFIETGAVLAASAVLAAGVASPGLASAQAQDMALPPPRTTGGKPLMEALMERRSTRRFSSRLLEPQVLSNLLWAAFGINRSDGSGKRTAPSWKNRQEMTVYAALPGGLYRYDAMGHALAVVSAKDVRALTGRQDFVATAPLNLIYVVDFSKMSDAAPEEKLLVAGYDSGSIFQNVYLACASLGLATVVRANGDKSALAKEMNLGADQMVTLAQTVGYPAG
ncbi:MAG: nitroreductase family protein [Acidobacteriota bacterium]